jgi:hypothetical protein
LCLESNFWNFLNSFRTGNISKRTNLNLSAEPAPTSPTRSAQTALTHVGPSGPAITATTHRRRPVPLACMRLTPGSALHSMGEHLSPTHALALPPPSTTRRLSFTTPPSEPQDAVVGLLLDSPAWSPAGARRRLPELREVELHPGSCFPSLEDHRFVAVA